MKAFFSIIAVGLASIPLALAAGCGSSGDTNPTGSGGAGGSMDHVTLDAACADLAKADCDNSQKCTSQYFEVDYPDQASCEARTKLWCVGAYGRPSASAMPAEVSACGQSVDSASCDATDFPACDLPGKLADGAGCYSYSDCKSDNCWFDYSCNDPSGVCPIPTCGTCVTPKALGEACKDGQCGTGLYCSITGAKAGKCAKSSADGEACSDSTACAGYHNCVKGKCEPPRGFGESCDELTGAFCDFEVLAQCDVSLKKCVPSKIVGAGADCSYDTKTETAPYCKGGLICNDSNRCVAVAADGAACKVDPQSGIDNCFFPATCQNGHCSTTPPACH